jgi:uncharacterized membrane protein YsdA (DUF1294 family)
VHLLTSSLIAPPRDHSGGARRTSAADKDHWRTKESTLHRFGLIGGWPGALLAQRVFRHKSRKREFQIVFWATIVLNCVALMVYSSPTASRALLSILGAAK